MQTIEIKEDLDDPKERARRALEKRKQKEAEANMSKNKMPVTSSNTTKQNLNRKDHYLDQQIYRRRYKRSCQNFQDGFSTW
jgi:hypothetical protein